MVVNAADAKIFYHLIGRECALLCVTKLLWVRHEAERLLALCSVKSHKTVGNWA